MIVSDADSCAHTYTFDNVLMAVYEPKDVSITDFGWKFDESRIQRDWEKKRHV